MAKKAGRAPKRSIRRSQTCRGSPKTTHRVTENVSERNSGGKVVEANLKQGSRHTRVDDVLRHIRPEVTVDDALKSTIANTIRNTAADIKSKGDTGWYNAVESHRLLRSNLTTALGTPHVDFTRENPLVVIIVEHFATHKKAAASKKAVKAFSGELATLWPEPSDANDGVFKRPEPAALSELAQSVLQRSVTPGEVDVLNDVSDVNHKRILKTVINICEQHFENAGCLIPWDGDRAMSAFAVAVTAVEPLSLSKLRCWTAHKWIDKNIERFYFFNSINEDTRDFVPVGDAVDAVELDCMATEMPVICGESGSGKTSLALAKAKGLVIHVNFNRSEIFKDLWAHCIPEKVDLNVHAIARGIADPIMNTLRSKYGAPAGDFPLEPGQELTIVFDEMGLCEKVVRALCRRNDKVRPLLATMFGVAKVGLIVVGTGTETGSNAPGSLIEFYRLHKLPRLPDYWANHYMALTNKKNLHNKKASRPLSRMIAHAAPPRDQIMQSIAKHKEKSKQLAQVRLGPLHTLVLRLCGNARFAAILADTINRHHEGLAEMCKPNRPGTETNGADLERLEAGTTARTRQWVSKASTSALMAVTNVALEVFVQANGLKECRGCLLADIAVAAELVVNGATWLRVMADSGTWNKLNNDYGIVTCGMSRVKQNDAANYARFTLASNKKTYTVLSHVPGRTSAPPPLTSADGKVTEVESSEIVWTLGYHKDGVDFLSMPTGTPYVQMSEFAAIIPLLEGGLLWVPEGTADGFEWTVASAAALYCMMPAVNVKDTANVDVSVLTPLRLLLNDLGSKVNADYVSFSAAMPNPIYKVERVVSKEAIDYRKSDATLSAWLADIRAWILNGASVVVINGPMASYADVIVFAPGRLVLLQCMSFEGMRLLTDAIVNEAFANLMPLVNTAANDDGSNVTEKLIAACLGEDQLVRTQQPAGAAATPVTREFVVEAAIVFEGPRSCIDSEVLPAGEMSAAYRYQGSESHVVVYTTAKVTFRFHVIDVTKDPRSDRLHGLHPVAQTSWLEAQV